MKNSLLWSISRDSSPTSYLFGTMHVKDNLAFTHIDKAFSALYKCSQFKAEIDLESAQTSIPQDVYLIPDGKSIRDYVTPKKFLKMRKSMLKSFGLDLLHFDRLLPIMIFNKVAESQLSLDNPEPLDLHLWKEAKRMNMELGGVEELSEHLGVLNKLELATQVTMLKNLLSNTGKFRKSMTKLCELYEKEQIHELCKRSKKDMGSLKKVLIYDRNQLMADRIEENIGNACFYAVGAAHLAGKKGILRFLKKKGIKIKAR